MYKSGKLRSKPIQKRSSFHSSTSSTHTSTKIQKKWGTVRKSSEKCEMVAFFALGLRVREWPSRNWWRQIRQNLRHRVVVGVGKRHWDVTRASAAKYEWCKEWMKNIFWDWKDQEDKRVVLCRWQGKGEQVCLCSRRWRSFNKFGGLRHWMNWYVTHYVHIGLRYEYDTRHHIKYVRG